MSRNFTYAVYGGIAAQNDSLSPADPNNSVQGSHIGLKISGEFYDNRNKNTLLSGYASYSTNSSLLLPAPEDGWTAYELAVPWPRGHGVGQQLLPAMAPWHASHWLQDGAGPACPAGYLNDAASAPAPTASSTAASPFEATALTIHSPRFSIAKAAPARFGAVRPGRDATEPANASASPSAGLSKIS